MAKPRLVEGNVSGRELRQAQEQESASIDPSAKGGVTLRGIALTTTGKKVAHGLGVMPQGWSVIRMRASVSPGYPYETAAPTVTHLTLALGAAGTVDLRVW